MRKYLLGMLPDHEAMAIEELYFTNRSFFDDIRTVEVGLIRDYFDGALEGSERKQFEARYLQVPELRRLVDEVRQCHLPSASSARWRPLGWALAVTLGCGAVIALVVFSRNIKSPIKLSQQSSARGVHLFLEPGVTKGQSTQSELKLPATPQPVTITAELPGEKSPSQYAAHLFVVQVDGARHNIWSAGGITSVPRSGGQQVTVAFPSSLLSVGDYILEIKMEGGSEQETYVFRVIAPTL